MLLDPRHSWLAEHVAATSNCSVQIVRQDLLSESNRSSVADFLDSAAQLLYVTVCSNAEEFNVHASTKTLAYTAHCARVLVFRKQLAEAVGHDDLHNQVTVCSLPEVNGASLFHILHDVFVPMLASSNSEIDEKTLQLLQQIDNSLGASFRKQQIPSSARAPPGISSPFDEVNLRLAGFVDVLCLSKGHL
jgi:hypothetical protein